MKREKTAGAVSADGEVRVPEWEELGYTRLFSERVQNRLIAKELWSTPDAKSEERVRKEQERKELEKKRKVEGAALAAFRRG